MIFKKNDDIIDFLDFDQNVLIWRFPRINFSMYSSIIVPTGCVAIFLSNGVIKDIIEPGKYDLGDDNRSFWKKLFVKEEKVVRCQVYYVNQTVPIIGYWGTKSPIEFREKETNIPVSMGVSGSFKIKIADPKVAFVKLVGAQKELTLDYVTEYFRSSISQEARTVLAETMRENSYYEMVNDTKLLSRKTEDILRDKFEKYGIELTEFFVEGLAFPDDVKEMLNNYARDEFKYKMEKHQREIRAGEIKTKKDEDREERMQEVDDECIIREKLFNSEKGAREEGRIDVKVVADVVSTINKSAPVSASKPEVSEGIFCMECGHKNPQNAKCCCECGSKLVIKKEVCECGAPIIDNAKFCPNCGKAIRK